MEGIDMPYSVAGKVSDVVASGFHALIRYISPNTSTFPTKQLTSSEADAIFAIEGTGIGLVFEQDPTSLRYFETVSGAHDAGAALAAAKAIGVPLHVPIFFAVDYDAPSDDMAAIRRYFQEVHSAMTEAGRLTGVYGSGQVCGMLHGAGFVHYTHLAQSRGWSDREAWQPYADIVQGESKTLAGLDVDTDVVRNLDVLWRKP